MSLAILFHFLCAQHVSDINISIIRSLQLFCWITTLVVLFLDRCVLEFRCGWVGVVSVLQASACNLLHYFTRRNVTQNTAFFFAGFGVPSAVSDCSVVCRLYLWNVWLCANAKIWPAFSVGTEGTLIPVCFFQSDLHYCYYNTLHCISTACWINTRFNAKLCLTDARINVTKFPSSILCIIFNYL